MSSDGPRTTPFGAGMRERCIHLGRGGSSGRRPQRTRRIATTALHFSAACAFAAYPHLRTRLARQQPQGIVA